jgi:mono/diheme cytochrome c family protein
MSSAPEQHQMHHPTFKQYVLIATILFAVTIVEFLIILPGDWRGQGWTIAPLVILSAFKFAIVIMFYMHLKFEAPMFSVVFLAGLALAFAVGLAAIGLFGSFTPDQRAFAEDNAVAFVHAPEGGSGHAPAPAPTAVPPTAATPTQPDAPPPTAVPVAQPSAPADGADTAAGQAVFTGRAACFTCHTIDGIATGLLGPSLDGIATAAATRNPPQSAEDYIRESINDPDAFIWEGCVTGTNTPCPAGLMATLVTPANLTDAEIDAVVAFLLTQK